MRKTLLLSILGLGLTGQALASVPILRDKTFLTDDGVRLHYMEGGRGPLMVFLPGWTMPASIWKDQLTRFAQDHHVVALDPRSQGLSETSPRHQHPLGWAEDLETLLRRLGDQPAVLVGWSLGGTALLAYLRDHDGSRVRALVLVDAATGSSKPGGLSKRRAAFLDALRQDREKATRNFVVGMFRKDPPPSLIRDLIRSSLRMPLDQALELLQGEYDAPSWTPPDGSLRVPILYLSSPGYLEAGRWLLKRSPQAKLANFPGSGHAFFVDQPDAFEANVRGFLDYLPDRPQDPRP